MIAALIAQLREMEYTKRALGGSAAADALAEAIRRIEAQTWRPIAEAPADDVLLMGDDDNVTKGMRWVSSPNGWGYYAPNNVIEFLDWEPTHWMPLPPAPTGEP